MTSPRDIRKCALQALYQFDVGRHDELDVVLDSLKESPGDESAHRRGFDLASMVWEHRDEADAAIAVLTPDWPTHRQPVVDRNILRLAWYELTRTDTPAKIVIDEAIELAKEFSTERSPTFINGVLDRLYKQKLQIPSDSTQT